MMARFFLAFAFAVLPGFLMACEGPYKVTRSDGRCVWSCAAGTQPDAARGECACKPGLRETGKDRLGRRECAAGAASKDKSSGVKKRVKRYGQHYPFNRSRGDLCARFAQFDEPGWPVKCRVGRAQLRTTIIRPLEIIVRRSASMQAEEFVPGRYTFRITTPNAPPRNRDCDESVSGVRGSCRPVCERMEMLTFFDTGQLAGIKRPDHGDLGRCEAVLSAPYQIGNPTRARAWDTCVSQAERRNLNQWNHRVRIEIPRFVAADFGFRDARTRQTSQGWRYVKKVNHQIREAVALLPVIVHCRP